MRLVISAFCCAILFPVTLTQAITVGTCRCVDRDENVRELWDFCQNPPSNRWITWIDYDPYSYFSCCSLWRDEAMAELSPIWARIKSSIKDGRARRQDLLIKNGSEKRFSLLLQFADLEIEYLNLCHEMSRKSLELSDKYSCLTTGLATGHFCCETTFTPLRDLDVERDLESSFHISRINRTEAEVKKITSALEEAYQECLWKHKCRQTYYEYGLLCQSQKKYWKSAYLISSYIQCTKDLSGKTVPVESYTSLSDSYQLMFQYDKAIEALTEAIEKYPDRKELHVKRVAAYFELGKTDEAIQDFLEAELDDQLVPDPSQAIQARAFASGASCGLAEGLREFPASCLYSLRGAGQLLWAGASNPIEVPSAFMDGLQTVTKAFREKEFGEILQHITPELHALATSWDSLPVDDRWEKLGFAFGKYGFDMFSSMGTRKLQEAFLKLKSTNTLCNVKTLASSEGKDSIKAASEQIATKRKAFFEQSKIQWDKQGKHVEGHNSRNTLTKRDIETYSILTHKDPEGLLREHSGRGSPKPIAEKEPWERGYKEDVNFGQPIGTWKSKTNTGESRETTWGRIYYGKDGSAHIVPIKPKDDL